MTYEDMSVYNANAVNYTKVDEDIRLLPPGYPKAISKHGKAVSRFASQIVNDVSGGLEQGSRLVF